MNPDDLYAAGLAAIEQQQLDTARPLWSRLCEVEPLEIDNWLILAAIDEGLGFYPAALGHLKYAFQLSPDDGDVWLKSAQIKWKMRDFNGALGDVTRALSLDFRNFEVRLLLAAWLCQLHKFEPAFGHFRYLLASGEKSEDVLVDALACAYLSDEVFTPEKWCVDAGVSISTSRVRLIASRVAERVSEWLPPASWPQQNNAPGVASRGDGSLFQHVSNLLSQHREHFDWRRYLDSIAHTEEQVSPLSVHEAFSSLVKLVRRFLGVNPADLRQVLEFGCGTGLLGQHLKAVDANSLLTGIAYSDVVLKVANGKNNYDTLLHRSKLPRIDAGLLNEVACVVVQARVAYFESRVGLLETLLECAAPQAVIVFVFDPASVDQSEITDQLKEHGTQFNWQLLGESAGKYGALIVNQRIPANEPGSTGVVDQVEQAGNELISATTALKQASFDQCKQACQTALKLKPCASQALFSLGIIAQDAGDHARAISYYRRARMRYLGYADNWFQIATIHQHRGNVQAMFNAYRKCLSFAPSHMAALQNLVSLYFSEQNVDAVWHHLRLMLSQYALDESILQKVANTVEQSQNEQLQKNYREFIAGAEWLKVRFNAALQSKYFDRAEKHLVELEALKQDKESELLRAQLEEKSGRLSQAKQRLQALRGQDGQNEMYSHAIASICADQGLIKEAYRAWLSALDITPIENQNLQNSLFFANYCNFISDETVSKHHFDWGRALSGKKAEQRSNQPALVSGRRKIRVGYVSADFRMHSVSMFLYNILKHHDTDKFSVYCYSMTPAEDPMTIKLRYFSDYWRNINFMGDEEVAERIRLDKIDILVDLAGHTGGNRLPLFALRPAPVQCSYLGYPNTTGLLEMDYRLTDNEADPPGLTEHLHTENLVRLPHGFLSYSRHLASTPVTLYEQQSEARRYTFACCNNIFKINESVVDVFAEILKRMPDASLLLKAHNLNNPEIIEHYRSLFQARGIGKQQLHLMNTIDVDEHQNLYNNIDIALDPFPYNGTTTTCDALWMGVPVLALAGTRHAGRVGVSLLTRVGLNDWIAQNKEEYIEKAITFARDSTLLANIKREMRQRLLNSPLMRPGVVTGDIERAYLEMMER